MIVGFTGSRSAMTEAQYLSLRQLLSELDPWEFHHGDCVGSDAQAHGLATALHVPTVVHPPDERRYRAFCQASLYTHAPKPYLERNHDIVDASTILLATPNSPTERLRSGTWATVRYARRRHRPLVVVNPDGTLAREPSES